MNTRAKKMAMAAALAASALTLQAQAADGSVPFDPETGYYYDEPAVQPTPARAEPQTPRQAEENRWLELERERGSTSEAPVPFPPPEATAADGDSAGGR